jgi:hypothetical protein
MTSTQSRVAPRPTPSAGRTTAAPRLPRPPAPSPLPVRRTRVAGRWRYDRQSGEWWWSPEMSSLYGLDGDGRGPCTEVLVAAEHPDDRPRTIDALSAAVTGAEGFCVVVEAPRAADERVRALETEVAQLRTAMAGRAPIEQAKGVLMLLTGCGEQVAFDLLAHISSHTHRKVREVALDLVASAAGRRPLSAEVRAILRDACPPGSGGH